MKKQSKAKNKQVRADKVAVHCSCTEVVDIDKLIPNPKNPNMHTEDQVQRLARNIKRLGWRCPITVSNRSGFIVRGHGRLMAAQKLDVSEVPVDYQDYETEAEEYADLVADNIIPELSTTDNDLLSEIVLDLKEADFDLELTGMDEKQIDDLLGEIDDGGEAGGEGDSIPEEQYHVVCECESEREQQEVFEKLQAGGYKCKLLTL